MTFDQPNRTLKVMTYNIGNGLVAPDRIHHLIHESDADIIGFEEVSPAQGEAIESANSATLSHSIVSGTGFSGRALLSRRPIESSAWLDLVPERPDLKAIVTIDELAVTIIVAHPPPPRLRKSGVIFDSTSSAQIVALAQIAVASAPAILLGDFNMTKRNPLHGQMATIGLTDAWLAAGDRAGSTFPLRLGHTRRINHRMTWLRLAALARIDYVWHTGDLVTIATGHGPDEGSDHRPVWATIALPDPVKGQTLD